MFFFFTFYQIRRQRVKQKHLLVRTISLSLVSDSPAPLLWVLVFSAIDKAITMPAPDQRVAALVEASSRAVLATHVDPRDDMAAERRRGAALPVEAVSLLLHGGDGGKIKRM